MMVKVRRLKVEHGGIDLVVYLQLMRSRDSFKRSEQETSEIARLLKRLAMELSVPVIALSQINRAVEEREDKRPTLADLLEVGSMEQTADVIMFLYRDEVYNRSDTSNEGKAELKVTKQRKGHSDTVLLTFLSNCGRFVPYSQIEHRQASGDFC
jgi:replicative DNA helicase